MKLLQDSLRPFVILRNKTHIDNNLEKEIVRDRLFVFDYVKFLINAKEKALENTREYKDCLESINRDHIINGQLKAKVVVLGVVNRINPKSFLMHILIMLISDYIISRRIDDFLLFPSVESPSHLSHF